MTQQVHVLQIATGPNNREAKGVYTSRHYAECAARYLQAKHSAYGVKAEIYIRTFNLNGLEEEVNVPALSNLLIDNGPI